jgi:hypothetical protein
MNKPDVTGLLPSVAGKIAPMLQDMLAHYGRNIHSFHIVGSAVIPDYNEKLSDINSVVVLHDMDLRFIEFLAPLGGKYGKKRIAAPLVMTPGYIKDSLDAFPVEFLDFKLLHQTLYGEDLFTGLELDRTNLRLQCEREIKTKQIGLRQGYVSSLGKKEQLSGALARSFTGSMPLFRAVIVLLGKQPPIARAEVIAAFTACCGIDSSILEELLALKNARLKPTEQDLRDMFERYYRSLETIGKIIDELR